MFEQAQNARAHDVAMQLKGLHALKRLFYFRGDGEALVAKRAQRLHQVLHLHVGLMHSKGEHRVDDYND